MTFLTAMILILTLSYGTLLYSAPHPTLPTGMISLRTYLLCLLAASVPYMLRFALDGISWDVLFGLVLGGCVVVAVGGAIILGDGDGEGGQGAGQGYDGVEGVDERKDE